MLDGIYRHMCLPTPSLSAQYRPNCSIISYIHRLYIHFISEKKWPPKKKTTWQWNFCPFSMGENFCIFCWPFCGVPRCLRQSFGQTPVPGVTLTLHIGVGFGPLKLLQLGHWVCRARMETHPLAFGGVGMVFAVSLLHLYLEKIRAKIKKTTLPRFNQIHPQLLYDYSWMMSDILIYPPCHDKHTMSPLLVWNNSSHQKSKQSFKKLGSFSTQWSTGLILTCEFFRSRKQKDVEEFWDRCQLMRFLSSIEKVILF